MSEEAVAVEGQTEQAERNWTEGLQGEQFTPEVKTALAAKYKTASDMATNHLDLEKQVRGKPFRLPESLDKLDEKSKGEFNASIGKLLGAVEKPEDLKDIDFTAGMVKVEGQENKADEGLKAAITDFAVKNHWPKGKVQEGVALWNQTMAQAKEQQAQQAKANADATQKALLETYGSAEEVAKNSELVRRAFQNHAGLTAEEYEQSGVAISQIFSQSPALSKALIKMVAPLAAEDSSQGGDGGKPKEPEKSWGEKEGLPNTAKALWPEGEKR